MNYFNFEPKTLIQEGFKCFTIDKKYQISEGDEKSKCQDVSFFTKEKNHFLFEITPNGEGYNGRPNGHTIKITIDTSDPLVQKFIEKNKEKEKEILRYTSLLSPIHTYSYTQIKALTDSLFQKSEEQRPFIRPYGLKDFQEIETLAKKIGLKHQNYSKSQGQNQYSVYRIPINKRGYLSIVSILSENPITKEQNFSMSSCYLPNRSKSIYSMNKVNFTLLTKSFYPPAIQNSLNEEEKNFFNGLYNTLNFSPKTFLEQQIELGRELNKESAFRNLSKKTKEQEIR